MTSALSDVFRREGRVWLRGALDREVLKGLAEAVDLRSRPGQRLRVCDFGGAMQRVTEAVAPVLPGARAVRAVGFNKDTTANWGVPWHQDRVVAVADKAEIPGWQGWSRKAGIWHCEPPAAFLERMVFLRVFLDPVSANSGGMHFAVGSHREGAVSFDRAGAVAERYPVEVEEAESGDLLLLHMLTLHRSVPSSSAASRRVFRIDFSGDALPAPLNWAT